MTEPVKCSWGGCGRDAKWQIVIKLWSLLTAKPARTDKNCIRMLSGVTICDECRERVSAQHFLLPEGRERIAQGLYRAGRSFPDFENAEVDFEPIIDRPIDPEEIVRQAKLSGGRIIEA